MQNKELRNRQERWQSETLYSQYLKNIRDKIDNDITWRWLNNGELKKEQTAALIAAQGQTLCTDAYKLRLMK